ncbi:MAG: AAA family ATPase [Nitrospirae bacterium YQR-1]
MTNEIMPKWAREIIRFLTIKPQFILWGNVFDIYPIEISGAVTTLKMTDYLHRILKEAGYSIILAYEPLYGFEVMEGEPEKIKKITPEEIKKEKPYPCTPLKAAGIIEQFSTTNTTYTAVIMNFASRLQDIAPNDMQELYYRAYHLSQKSIPVIADGAAFPQFNLIIWLLNKENDIPAWFTLESPKVKVLAVPRPDFHLRKIIIENLAKNITGFNTLDDNRKGENINLFIDQTNNLHGTEIISIVSLARKQGIVFSEIGSAIRAYKLGIVENPWSKLDFDKISKSVEILSLRVKGQPHAIRRAQDIVKRAVFNLSGAQYSKFSQRPKGVLFFAGPTGVGKTELARALTELLFGSETSYIRFDMSEFSKEHADQRLVGAPPGYVGYDVGGELTNSVKQNPFSVILFDEIEKANPKILDIFLQILDDGRLTSGRGETVYFSESLIIFTSNLGIYDISAEGQKKMRVDPGMPLDAITTEIQTAIEDFFKYKLGRPEILNRIGDNIVVFDFIRPESAAAIVKKMISSVLEKIEDSFKITVKLTDEVSKKLNDYCCADLTMGGRGIGNKLETAFVNPVSRALFDYGIKPGETVTVTDLTESEQVWEIIIAEIYI